MKKLATLAALIMCMAVPAATESCTTQQALAAENFITDLTNAVCTPLEQQANIQYVDFACNIASSVEGIVTVLTNGAQATVVSPSQVVVHVPAASAQSFAALHTTAAVAARKASRGK